MKFSRYLRAARKLSNRPLIISAGMPRSGSTLLFNLLKEILSIKYGDNFSYGWIGDLETLQRKKLFLLKTHRLSLLHSLRAKIAFYTYRDVRTAAVSAQKKFGKKPTITFFSNQISNYEFAQKNCELCIKYEDLMVEPLVYVESISRILDIHVNIEQIWDSVKTISPPVAGSYSKSSLLHSDHITNTGDEEWRNVIDKDLLSELMEKYNWWFIECGYSLD